MDKVKTNISNTKRALLKALRKTSCNVKKACEIVGVNRKTFYEYKDKYPKFRKDFEWMRSEQIEDRLDRCEDGMDYLIDNKSLGAIGMYLENFGQPRGWFKPKVIEDAEIKPTTFVFQVVDKIDLDK